MSLIKKIFISGVIAIVISSTIQAQDFTEEFESLINTEKTNSSSRKNAHQPESFMG